MEHLKINLSIKSAYIHHGHHRRELYICTRVSSRKTRLRVAPKCNKCRAPKERVCVCVYTHVRGYAAAARARNVTRGSVTAQGQGEGEGSKDGGEDRLCYLAEEPALHVTLAGVGVVNDVRYGALLLSRHRATTVAGGLAVDRDLASPSGERLTIAGMLSLSDVLSRPSTLSSRPTVVILAENRARATRLYPRESHVTGRRGGSRVLSPRRSTRTAVKSP